jgi:hypothetical protein
MIIFSIAFSEAGFNNRIQVGGVGENMLVKHELVSKAFVIFISALHCQAL